jgi:hypothetical protein
MDFDPRDDDSRHDDRHGTTASRDGRNASDNRDHDHDHHWSQPDTQTRDRDDDARSLGRGPGNDRQGSELSHTPGNLNLPRAAIGCQSIVSRLAARAPRVDLRLVGRREVRARVDGNVPSAIRMKRSGCNRLATEMPSSMASQWMLMPPPMGSHCSTSDRRATSTAFMPEREDFDPLWVAEQPIVDVIANAREPKAANAGQGDIHGRGYLRGVGQR